MKIHAFSAEGADPAYCEWSTDGEVIKSLFEDAIACPLFDTRNMIRFEMDFKSVKDFKASFASAVKSGNYRIHQARPAIAACDLTQEKHQVKHRDVISFASLCAPYMAPQASNDNERSERVDVVFSQRRENRTQAMAYAHAH
mgnify:CR=1 FL=1